MKASCLIKKVAVPGFVLSVIGNPPLRERTERRLSLLMDRGSVGSPRRCQDWEYFSLRRKGEQGRGRPFSRRVEDLASEMTFALQQLGIESGEGSER